MNENDENIHEPFATMLAAAYLAYQMGITYQTAEKKVRQMGPVGPYWLRLAETITRERVEAMNARPRFGGAHLDRSETSGWALPTKKEPRS